MLELKTVLIIAIATSRVFFPGMPGGPEAAPGAAKSFTVELYSNGKVPTDAKAELSVPEGLKMGSSIKLRIGSPEPDHTEDTTADSTVVYKSYWGCGDSIPDGQPKLIKAGQPGAFPTPPAYPKGSYAYWPAMTNIEPSAEAAVPGTYKLTTSYAGNAYFTIDEQEDFLAGIELVQPVEKPNIEKAVKIEWKLVPNAVGYVLTAFGGSEKLSVDWTSSADPSRTTYVDSLPLGSDDVKMMIEGKCLIAPDATSCTIPAGVFKGCDGVVLTITALGKDKILSTGGVETRIIVRSTLSVPLRVPSSSG